LKIIHKNIEFIIITGMSGAGKTQALNFFEDRGFFCIDNLPAGLLMNFLDIYDKSNGKIKKLAFVIDIRSWDFIDELYKQIRILDEHNIKHKIIFLDARNEVIVNRFNLTRRKHPVDKHETLLNNIEEERFNIEEIKKMSNFIIDTSEIKVSELFQKLDEELNYNTNLKMNITFVSFGYKYGIPLDLDMMFDVRFLPNPYYIEELKEKTGNDIIIQEYVMKHVESNNFYSKLVDLLIFLIPYFIKEGKSHFTVGIGCTGGKHRSVTFVNKLYNFFYEKNEYNINYYHRDVSK